MFQSNEIKFIKFHFVMKSREAKYPFLISNIDRTAKEETYWWGLLDIHPGTKIFLFNTFDVVGLFPFC